MRLHRLHSNRYNGNVLCQVTMPLGLNPLFATSAKGLSEFVCRDPRLASDHMRCTFTQHKMKVLGLPQHFRAQLQTLQLGGLRLSSLAFATEVELAQDPDPNYLLISTQTQGHAQIRCAGQEYSGGSGMVVIDSPYLPVVKRFSADSRRIHLRFDTLAVEACCAKLLGHGLEHPVQFAPFIPDAAATHRHWMALLQLLFTYVEQDPGGSSRLTAPMMRQLEETALLILLNEHEHTYSAELRAPAPWAPGHVRRAEAFIRAHAREPLELSTIAKAVAVSLRTLSQGFREFRQTTPMKFLQETRLDGARKDLLSASPGRTVAEVAQSWGCLHLGRFAEAYRQRFGELPSTTRKGQ